MKTALIIDGNYLLMKDVFILHYMKSLYVDLENLLRKDVEKLMKFYPFDKVYFVSDCKGSYWRRDVFNGYKGDRKADEKIDWNWVYGKYDELKEEMKNNPRINFLEVDKCEGDDLIAYLVNEGNQKGYSYFVMASDSDLHQLLRFDIHNDFINVMYNFKYSDEKIYLPKNHNVFLREKDKGEMSLFDMCDDDEYLNFLDEIKNKSTAVEVDTEELLFIKLVKGDKKDSIPSIYYKGKRGIGEKGALTLYEQYKQVDDSKIDFDSDEFIEKATDIVKYNKKIETDDVETTDLIKSNLKLNRQLTVLDNKYVPSSVLQEIKNNINI